MQNKQAPPKMFFFFLKMWGSKAPPALNDRSVLATVIMQFGVANLAVVVRTE